jgi:hypothetical protein
MNIEKHINKDNKILFITFGGLANQLSMPQFEFRNFLTNNFKSIDFVFIKDPGQFWYFNGIPGLGNNIHEVSEYLKNMIDEIKPEKVITLGTSAGGFASILFGNLIGADHLISFNPQTILNKTINHVGHARKLEVLRILGESNKYYDLLNLDNNIDQKIHIVYGNNDKNDVNMAKRMEVWPNVKTYAFKGDHGIVRVLRQNGELLKFFNEII